MLLVDDRDQGGRVVLELAQDRGQQQLADLEPLVGHVAQLDQLEHAVRLISETSEGGTTRRPHHGDVMAQAAQLVLHQLLVLAAEPIDVAMHQVSELDVIEASVITLCSCRQVDAYRAV